MFLFNNTVVLHEDDKAWTAVSAWGKDLHIS